MESQVLWAFGKYPNKKTLKFHLELNAENFQEKEKLKSFGIDIIGFFYQHN